MSEKTRTYEGMFLLDAGAGSFEAASEPIRTVLERVEAKVLAIKPWDERRLAYEIQGRKRGLYVLTYFQADPARITELEHDCQLSAEILRALFLRRDHLTEETINAETPATSGARRSDEEEPAERDERGRRRRRRDEGENDTDSNEGADDENDSSDDSEDSDDQKDDEG